MTCASGTHVKKRKKDKNIPSQKTHKNTFDFDTLKILAYFFWVNFGVHLVHHYFFKLLKITSVAVSSQQESFLIATEVQWRSTSKLMSEERGWRRVGGEPLQVSRQPQPLLTIQHTWRQCDESDSKTCVTAFPSSRYGGRGTRTSWGWSDHRRSPLLRLVPTYQSFSQVSENHHL
jgi:hypothetical protein